MEEVQKSEDMNLVIVGHVDHGKSTLIGRLLADTGSLPEGKLDRIKETCRRNARPFEYAFLLDALKDEQAQGITIDAARCFFKTELRSYIILDAPGHIEFLKNMVTGAARAEAAVLVIDAKEGVRENSRRHGYMLSMLGIRQIAVVINKMDLVDYNQDIFESVKKEYLEFLDEIKIEPAFVLPISAFEGDNIISLSSRMPWYQGKTVLEVLDAFQCEKAETEQDFRMPVQDVYKFTRDGDDRRIVAGTVTSGRIKNGDEVIFYPSGKKSYIKTIEAFHEPSCDCVAAGKAVGFTLKEQIYVKRGELMACSGQNRPLTGKRIAVNLFWLGKNSMCPGKTYYLKIGTDKVRMELEAVIRTIDSSNLASSKKDQVDRNEVAECVLRTDHDIAFDLVGHNAATSRFVIVDQYEIAGGGIITGVLADSTSGIRSRVMMRNYKWENSSIPPEERMEHYAQKPLLLLITGEPNSGKRVLAKAFEKYLLERSRFVYYLGIGSFLYGVDSDMKLSDRNDQEEHIRRFAEVANLMLDAGLILIVTARNLTQADMNIMHAVISGDIDTVWIGKDIVTDLKPGLHIRKADPEDTVLLLKDMLREKGIIFRV